MLKSNLIEALRTFSPKEMKELGEFVASPFFNKNKNVIKLYEIVKKYYPELTSEKLSKESVYSKLFPGESYKDSTIRLLMFYLYELIEKFIAHERYTRNEFTYRKNLLAEFNERSLFKDFEKHYDDAKEKLECGTVRDEIFYMNNYELASEYYDYLTKVHLEKYDKYITSENIEKIFSNLTYSYLINVLKFYAVVLNTQQMLNNEIKTELFENILKNFDTRIYKDVPLVNIYFHVIMMLLKPDEKKYYYELKELVDMHEDVLGHSGVTDIYINLENYCARMVRAGDVSFLKENFDIYKIELEKDLYKTNNYMSSPFYRSVVNVGCRLKEHEFLGEFIEKYKSELREDLRDSHYNFCRALLETDKHNFEGGLEFLSKVKTDDLYLKMDVRMLQSRLFYELDWDDSLNSLLDSFRRTLANNKLIPEHRKQQYSDFLKYLGKLNNIRHKADELDLDILRKQVKNENNFYHKPWLVIKIDELEEELTGKPVEVS